MKKLAVGLVIALGLGNMAAADPAAGIWRTEPGDTGGYLHVAVAPCGAALCGTIQSAFSKDGTEQADYEHKGKSMIWDMASEGSGSYSGGKIWAPDSGKTYASKMSLQSNSLTVKGCVAGGLICRGQTWKRVK